MIRVVWTTPARDDLRAIREFIGQDSERYARVVTERLVTSVQRLQEHPLSGRVVPEIGRQTIREVIDGAYRVVYRVTPNAIQILAVVHSAREFPSRALDASE